MSGAAEAGTGAAPGAAPAGAGVAPKAGQADAGAVAASGAGAVPGAADTAADEAPGAAAGGATAGGANGADAAAARRAAAATRAAATGRFLAPGQLDDLGRAVLYLARELWVTRDRLAVLEAVLDARGLDVSAEVAAHQPSPALAARLAAERKALVDGLMATLCPPEEEGPPAP